MIKKIALLCGIVFTTFLVIYCTTDEQTIIGPFGDTDKYLTVASISLDKTTVYSKGDLSVLSIKVLDVDNSPAIGLRVDFTAEFGSITESDTTDSSGIALAVFISDENTGENTITIDTGLKKYLLTINVVNYQPKYIELYSESPVLLADGISTTNITAVLKDSTGSPMSEMTVHFTTTLGALNSQIELTDNQGLATTVLTSTQEQGVATITASAGIEKSIDVLFHMDVPAVIELSAGNPVLLADGISTTTITAIVKDSLGNRMDNESVRFSTTNGMLSEELVATNNGLAESILTSSNTPGVALIIATSFISDSVEVEFNINVPTTIDMSASPTIILADGQSTSVITAIPKDQDGRPMPGLTVLFTTTLGTLSETFVLTDQDGIATTNLISGTTEGTALITATSSTEGSIGVQLIAYNPAYIDLTTEETSILGDGISKVNITAKVMDSANNILPGAIVNFSTTDGSLSKTSVRANQDGHALVTLTSAGSLWGTNVEITAEIQDTDISEIINIRFRGISMTTYPPDSIKYADGGLYKVFIHTKVGDIDEAEFIENATIEFNSTIGEMIPPIDFTNELGVASSMLSAEITGANQSGLVITPELFHAPEINHPTASMVIPGVEAIISTVDDEVMGDGESWVLLKSTLREITGGAITGTKVDWETTHGTIKRQSQTNTTGHSIDTLRIEHSVSSDTDVTVTAKYGENVTASDVLTFIEPVNDNRLILGFEPDTTGHGIIPCNIDTALAAKEVGVSAQLVDSAGNGLNWVSINFSVTPNNFASICPTDLTENNGLANVMMVYPPQNGGEIVRVWAEAPDGTKGSIDVILPVIGGEDDAGGG
jgi:adhesin/invasin